MNFKLWLEATTINLEKPKLSHGGGNFSNFDNDNDGYGGDDERYDPNELSLKIFKWVEISPFGRKIKRLTTEKLFSLPPKVMNPELDRDEVWFDVSWKNYYKTLQEEVEKILKTSDIYEVFEKQKYETSNLVDKYFEFIFSSIMHSFNYTLSQEASFHGYLWIKENWDNLVQQMLLLVKQGYKRHYGDGNFSKVFFNSKNMKKPQGSVMFEPMGMMAANARFAITYRMQ